MDLAKTAADEDGQHVGGPSTMTTVAASYLKSKSFRIGKAEVASPRDARYQPEQRLV